MKNKLQVNKKIIVPKYQDDGSVDFVEEEINEHVIVKEKIETDVHFDRYVNTFNTLRKIESIGVSDFKVGLDYRKKLVNQLKESISYLNNLLNQIKEGLNNCSLVKRKKVIVPKICFIFYPVVYC